MHLGGLESTQEASVALGLSPRANLTHLSCSPNFPRASITRYTHAKHEQILNYFAIIAFCSHSILLTNYTKNGRVAVPYNLI